MIMDTKDMQQTIAEDLGIIELTEAQQKKIIAEFGAVALQASLLAILEALSADNRAAFTALLDAKDDAGAEAFLDTHLPDHESISRQAVATEIARFRDFQKTV